VQTQHSSSPRERSRLDNSKQQPQEAAEDVVITLPRQARDKHSESTPKKAKKSTKTQQKKQKKKQKKAQKSTPKKERAVFFASSLLDAYDMADAAT
jgi:hypothetical protein